MLSHSYLEMLKAFDKPIADLRRDGPHWQIMLDLVESRDVACVCVRPKADYSSRKLQILLGVPGHGNVPALRPVAVPQAYLRGSCFADGLKAGI